MFGFCYHLPRASDLNLLKVSKGLTTENVTASAMGNKNFQGVLCMPTFLKPLLSISPVDGVESNRELLGKA